MGNPVSQEEHKRRKAEAKARKKIKKAEARRRSFIMDGEPAIEVSGTQTHTAQLYQARSQHDIAYDLTRELRPRHRRAVLGQKLYKAGHSYTTGGSN